MTLQVRGSSWAVATPNDAATDAASEAFLGRGNAVDAALAAATTLSVVYPHMCGVGGDLFALIRSPRGDVRTVISAGAAPLAIDPEAVRDRNDGTMPVHGTDTITVPGTVEGWETLHRAGAVLPWAAAFQSAIHHASHGTEVSGSLAWNLERDASRFAADPGLDSVFFDRGEPLLRGSTFRQTALAATLERIADEGSRVLYGGAVGARYVEGLGARGSVLSLEDLVVHRADVVSPLSFGYRDVDVFTSPPPSQGFALLRILAEIERRGIDPDPLGADVAELAGIVDRANRVRDRHLADPVRVDLQALIRGNGPSSTGRPPSGGDTIGLATADAEGWTVSLIQSLYDSFGSGILEPATGIVAHDRGACFTLERGHPNELLPGKRPAHTLMPVLVSLKGSVVAVAGTMGGEAQPQINAWNLIRILDLAMGPEEALTAPRWAVDGGRALVEEGVPPLVASALSDAGFAVDRAEGHDGQIGHSNLIQVRSDGFVAASDPRSDGSSAAG